MHTSFLCHLRGPIVPPRDRQIWTGRLLNISHFHAYLFPALGIYRQPCRGRGSGRCRAETHPSLTLLSRPCERRELYLYLCMSGRLHTSFLCRLRGPMVPPHDRQNLDKPLARISYFRACLFPALGIYRQPCRGRGSGRCRAETHPSLTFLSRPCERRELYLYLCMSGRLHTSFLCRLRRPMVPPHDRQNLDKPLARSSHFRAYLFPVFGVYR